MANPSGANPTDPPTGSGGGDLLGIGDGGTTGDTPPVVVVVDGAVAVCNAALANVEQAIKDHINDCLAACKVSVGSCEACIRGLIESQLEAVGQTVSKCDTRVVNSLVDQVTSLAMAAAAIGVMPPGTGDGGGGVGDVPPVTMVGADGGDFIIGPVGPPTVLEQGPPEIGKLPPQPACLPVDWTDAQILDWARTNIDPRAIIYQLPTKTDKGVAGVYEGRYPIPALCGPPSIPTIPYPDNSVTLPGGAGGGGTIVNIPTGPVPPFGGGGTIINIPSGGNNGTIINVPGNPSTGGINTTCPTPQQTIVNVPSCPQPTPTPECKPCTSVAVKQVTQAEIPDPSVTTSWDAWLVANSPGAAWKTYPTATAPGFAISQDGSACIVVAWYADASTAPKLPPDKIKLPNNAGGNICSPDTITAAAESFDRMAQQADGLGTLSLVPFSSLVGALSGKLFTKATGLDILPFAESIGTLVGGISGTTLAPWLRELITPTTKDKGCNSDGFIVSAIYRALGGAFGGWFGLVPPATTRVNDYVLNYFCPNTLPDQGEVNSLKLRGWINKEQWVDTTKMLGNCQGWQESIIEASQAMPGVNELITADRRQLLKPTEKDYLWEKAGVTNDRWREVFYRLTDYVPGPGDLVSFMVRDVFDPDVVSKYGLDSEFEQKFQGRVTDWAKSQGMDSDTFKYYWRAHWQYASPGQIYEMVHRLRLNDRDPNDPFANVTFTLEDARKALEVQDIAPYFVDRLIATSYRPLSQRLLANGIKSGEYDADAVKRSFLDQGYTQSDAEKLARAFLKIYAPAIAKANGLPTAAEIVKWYKSLAINRDDASGDLQKSGYTEEQAGVMLDSADQSLKAAARTKAMNSYKKRYMSGEFTDAEIIRSLIDAGLDNDRVGDTVLSWRFERMARFKGPTVAMLCTWLGKGMITPDDYFQRAANMGWSQTDAARIVQTCQLGIRDKQDKAIAAAAKKAETDAKAAVAKQKAAARDARAAAKTAHDDWLKALPCKPSKKPQCPAPAAAADLPIESPE